MGFSGLWIFLFSLVNLLPFQVSESATVLVDGVSEWRNPKVQMGDSVIFQHKFHYNLYIFQNQEAFSLCNFTRATLLTKPNSLYYTVHSCLNMLIISSLSHANDSLEWHTSRPGFFYFSFNNGSNKACLDGQNLAVQVSLPPHQDHAASPEPPPQLVVAAAPTPISGGNVASSRAFPWPFQPQELASPSPAPDLSLPATSPKGPDTEGLPFINSNPAVPLPTGEVDSATIRPLPASGHQHSKQDLGFSAVQRALSCIILVMTIMI
ncbi:hypothetical protein Sango_2346500 [Sesamum angolense]|uniref:Uncharacterized protein n=1 Tax=Sesamum angolense TaxID=2727404 RepID=A0AAE1W673_9LAMI|nr:hypothetical protein Sango_2346500 [Sesamum angolense]